MTKSQQTFHRFFWPALVLVGVLSHFSGYFISMLNQYYVVSDKTNYLLFLVPVGVLGSLVSIYQRYGIKRSGPLFIIWGIALFSTIALYSGDSLGSLIWILPIYASGIAGTIMIFVYSLRDVK